MATRLVEYLLCGESFNNDLFSLLYNPGFVIVYGAGMYCYPPPLAPEANWSTVPEIHQYMETIN